ncbi:hypothetical protein T310_2483 [Rasamsonia emersonii CBS 393.64]|uniref:STF2-like protein n=1 Tax=Rasamsonia emersonii (strain ATCC 16479 / CBS 393.64 / IMI 116815) TaxID=1408163 RepID=A0A0F4YYP3_RASE3|nr:hypothetical protein T310_2483 [Rasamsonia emersonii CBS 393.64]KKA23417.1 hypothetical protein T310_2483 [Rasamsonia emersonii CBS 393.64]
MIILHQAQTTQTLFTSLGLISKDLPSMTGLGRSSDSANVHGSDSGLHDEDTGQKARPDLGLWFFFFFFFFLGYFTSWRAQHPLSPMCNSTYSAKISGSNSSLKSEWIEGLATYRFPLPQVLLDNGSPVIIYIITLFSPPSTKSTCHIANKNLLSTSTKYHSEFTMTRSHKLNNRDHVAISDGTSTPHEHIPRYFAKSGPVDADPRKTKKDGGGKGNWGRSGDEVQDYEYNFTNVRRHSNSSGQGLADFKTKFETIEPEPVFEEELHGSSSEEHVTGSQ